MKKIGRLIFLVIIILIVCWVASRWNVWFNKHPEPQYSIVESVVGVQLTVGKEPLCQRVISWRSRPDSILLNDTSVVLYWMSATDTIKPLIHKKWIKSGGGEAIFYWAEVEVMPGCYNYAIETFDTITPYYSTKISDRDIIELLVLGDVQDKHPNLLTDSAVLALEQNYAPDYILQLGDLIDRPHQYAWDVYFASFAPLRTSVPTISIVGNHDYHKGINKYPDERFFYTFPYFLDKKNSAPLIGCCCLEFGKMQLYIIDSNQPIWNQIEQRRWLKNRLEASLNDTKKIVALHHPLRSARSIFNNIIVRLFYEPLILKYDVDLVLAGHEHTSCRLKSEQTGGYEQIITNFSSKNYVDSEGEQGRKELLLKIKVN